MSFLFPSSNTNSKSTLSKDFRVRSKTQLNKVSNTFWNKQLPKKGIKMKGEGGDLVYAKTPIVRARMLQLLKRRGYITDKTLKKDLVKDKVKSEDRRRMTNIMRAKFAKEARSELTPEQILAYVKRARAVSRLMNTRGISKAEQIVRGRDTTKMKDRFKEETYARLNVHGESHAISALGGQTVNPDDVRYKDQQASNKDHAASAINRGSIKSVAGENKEISSAKDNEKAIATGVGLKKINQVNDKAGASSQKTDGGVASNLAAIAPSQSKVLEKEGDRQTNDEFFKPHISSGRQVLDSEFQSGVILRSGKKTNHFSAAKKDNPEIDDFYKKAA